MPLPKEQAWFARRRYGWGWGLPTRWPGWVAFGAYVVALLLGALRVIEVHPGLYVLYVLGCSAVLMGICWWKGEAPRWQWGEDEETGEKKG